MKRRDFLIAGGTGLTALVAGGLLSLLQSTKQSFSNSPYVRMPTDTVTPFPTEEDMNKIPGLAGESGRDVWWAGRNNW
jgi:hypothetical protein